MTTFKHVLILIFLTISACRVNKYYNVLHIPVPIDAILGVDTVDVVLGRMIDDLLLPVMLADVFTTGTVIDFCRTLGDDWPEDTSIT